MVCDIIDFVCIIRNELIGNAILSVIIVSVLWFIFASKISLGFEATMIYGLLFLLMFGLLFGGFGAIYAFGTIFVAIGIGWAIQKVWNR